MPFAIRTRASTYGMPISTGGGTRFGLKTTRWTAARARACRTLSACCSALPLNSVGRLTKTADAPSYAVTSEPMSSRSAATASTPAGADVGFRARPRTLEPARMSAAATLAPCGPVTEWTTTTAGGSDEVMARR
jgi:hypothetical protein